MDIMNFIKPELLILIPVIYTIGLGIKKSKVPDKYIPIILGLISILLAMLWVISTSSIEGWQDAAHAIYVAITQGLLAAGASVYVNQLYIQSQKDK